MADEKTHDQAPGEVVNEETQSGSAVDADLTPAAPRVTTVEGALVGDENQPEPREVQVDVVKQDVAAQVMNDRIVPVDTVPVFEVSVTTDEVITDPNSPLGVQIPDAGRTPGNGLLPIHGFVGAKTVEQVFAEAADESDSES